MPEIKRFAVGCFLSSLLVASTLRVSWAQQLNMNEILNDPKLLLQHKEEVLAGYNNYAGAEAKYPEMKKKFNQLGNAVIKNHEAVRSRWVALAKEINEPERATMLNALATLFNDAVTRFNQTTYNSNATAVKEAAAKLQSVYNDLYQVAKVKADPSKNTIGDFNTALQALTKSSEEYVDYWNTSFKDVSDGRQIRIMTREAVLKAGNDGARELIERRDKQEALCKKTRAERDQILQRFIANPDGVDENQVNSLATVIKSLKDQDKELADIDKRLDEKNKELQQLLRDFGL